MNALRQGSVISQLENDQYNEAEGLDELERAWKRGHNFLVRSVVDLLRHGLEPMLAFAPEHIGDETSRANARGHNAGVRHVRVVMGLAELAHAPVIRTVELEHEGMDLRLKHALVGGDES